MKIHLRAEQWDTLLIEGLETGLSVPAMVQRCIDEYIRDVERRNNGKKRYVRRHDRIEPNDCETLPSVIGVC